MAPTSEERLDIATGHWLAAARQRLADRSGSCEELLHLARRGVLLRRRWDREAPGAALRKGLLEWLPAVQTLAQEKLNDGVGPAGQPPEDAVECVVRQLREDDQYLIELLDDVHSPAEQTAFAIECFRDDLHWLGTQVAALEGHRGVDFLGRVLLEQESLARDVEAWEEEWTTGSSPGGERCDRPRAGAAAKGVPDWLPRAIEPLRKAGQRLRRIAISRQVDGLCDEPEPTDWSGWFTRWQAASHLAMRLDSGSEAGECPGGGQGQSAEAARVEAIRREAIERWQAAVSDLDAEASQEAMEQVAGQLNDQAHESMTFLEDLPLGRAIRELEVLCEDLGVCRQAARDRDARKASRLAGACRRRVVVELQERRLARRMERCLGRRWVTALERFVLLLLLLFCLMLVLEGPLLRYEAQRRAVDGLQSGQSVVEPLFAWLDLGICLVLLAEFSFKLALAEPRWLYFRRNWLTGLLPAIPVGFFAYATHHLILAAESERIVLVRFLRYLRLPRMARWLRIARPVLQLGRLLAFTFRASDRLVRQLTPLLNRDVLLFQRGAVVATQPVWQTRLAALRERFYHRAMERREQLRLEAPVQLVQARMEDLAAMLGAPGIHVAPTTETAHAGPREMALERVIAWLLTATPAGISDRLGRNLARSVAQWCGALDVFGLRRLPLVRDLVAAGRLPSPYEATAQVANRIGLVLNGLLDRIYWLADLYGTVTAPQLVDSMGEYLVKGTARPARRLVLVGVGFLIVTYLTGWLPWAALHHLAELLRRLIGWPLVVLGGACMVFFALGMWLRQIAGQASEFYNQVADAQFIRGTRHQKRRLAEGYRRLLHERVVEPERELSGPGAAQSAEAAVRLMWLDYLDGAPFHPSDTRATNQLLGDPALVCLRDTRLRLTRRQRARLRRLDLVNNRLSLRGPYLWFHFISRSIIQQTARLVIDYNAFALPVERAETAEDWEIARYVEWLGRRLQRPVAELELPEPFRRRWEKLGPQPPLPPTPGANVRFFEGNDFTALHFLSTDPQLDEDIRRRYGPQVAELMARDRRDNIRRVFRTYPFHRWPRHRRVLNPLELYEQHLVGGRILLLPFKLFGWCCLLAWRGARMFWKFVQDVLETRVAEAIPLEDPDPYAVAVRKIHRMRKPLFVECLRMRAAVDPEYLGLRLPGLEKQARPGGIPQVDEDLKALGVTPALRAELRQLAKERHTQMLDLRRLLGQWEPPSRRPAALRAVAVAYAVDYRNARSTLEAARLVRRACDRALAEGPRRLAPPDWSPRALWCRWRFRKALRALFQQPEFRHYDGKQQAVCRRWIARRRGPLLDALRRLTANRQPWSTDPVAEAYRTLAAVARDPEPWSGQLVTLRTVQTLSVVDLKVYCELVAELGQYDRHEPG